MVRKEIGERRGKKIKRVRREIWRRKKVDRDGGELRSSDWR